MMDIFNITDDLVLHDAMNSKAANVLSIQIGALEYAKEFGIDLAFFIDPDFQFQNESFKAYLIQRLAEHHVNVNSFSQELETLFMKYTVTSGAVETTTGGFIR